MKGIIKKILTTILLIQIIFATLMSTGQVYGMEDLLLGNTATSNLTNSTVSTTNTTEISANSINTIYSPSGTVGTNPLTTDEMDAQQKLHESAKNILRRRN